MRARGRGRGTGTGTGRGSEHTRTLTLTLTPDPDPNPTADPSQASATGTRCLTEAEEQAGTNGCTSPYVTDNEKFAFGLIPKVLIRVGARARPRACLALALVHRHLQPYP